MASSGSSGYRALARREPRTRLVNASRSREIVQSDIRRLVDACLGAKT